MSLTAKQESACQAYVLSPDKKIKGNKSGAYREAYNTKNMQPLTINRAAKGLFDNLKIAARVKELQDEIKSALIADEVERQEFWSGVMRGDEKTEVTVEGVGVVDVKPEMKDRLKASELLGKNHGDFVEKKVIEFKNPADELARLKALALAASE